MLIASLSGTKAASTLTAWSFDNVAPGTSAGPATSAGFGPASALGFGGSSSPTVVMQPGSSTGGVNAWPVRGIGRQHHARGELLVERPEADRELVDLGVGPFAPSHPRGRAPGKEFRIARHTSFAQCALTIELQREGKRAGPLVMQSRISQPQ